MWRAMPWPQKKPHSLLVDGHPVDFDALWDKLETSIPKAWVSPPGKKPSNSPSPPVASSYAVTP